MSMPIVATAVPKMAPTLWPVALTTTGLRAQKRAGEERDADGDRGHEGRLEADGGAGDDVRRRAGLGRLGDLLAPVARRRRCSTG